MRFLEKPNLGVTPLEIYIDCVNEYTGKPHDKDSIQTAEEKRKRLLRCKKVVERSAKLYEDTIPHQDFEEPALPEGASRTELANVYDEKFVKGKKGRTYYDLICGRTKYGRCPICDAKDIELQLDHYLPKSKYPTLCVNPDNLIPICGTCNGIKHAKTFSSQKGMLLHLYMDKLPEKIDADGDSYVDQFLFADIDAHFVVTYRVECPADWDSAFRQRFENHMKLYKLTDKYSDCVKNEYSEIYSIWESRTKKHVKAWVNELEPTPHERKQLYDELMSRFDKKGMLRTIICEKADNEEFDHNSWRSVLYNALKFRVDDFAQWLEANNENL